MRLRLLPLRRHGLASALMNSALLASAGGLMGVPAAAAQERTPDVPVVELAGLVTLPVPMPDEVWRRAVGGEPTPFAIRINDGFRLIGRSTGILDLRPGDPALLPVSLAVGPDLPAGRTPALTAVFADALGEPGDSVTVEVDVAPRRGLRASLALPETQARPGSRIRIPFEITNTGNVADSVVVSAESRLGVATVGKDLLVLGPFETRPGEVEIDVFPDAIPLPTIVILRVAGDSVSSFATLDVPVGQSGDDLFGSLVHVPTRFFLGSSVRTAGETDLSPTYGIDAEGLLRPGVRLRVSAHGAPAGASSFAFRGLQFGSRFRAELDAPTFSVAAGDVYSRVAPFAGYRLQGRGGTAEADAGPLRFDAHAARPTGLQGAAIGGHQLAAGARVQTPHLVIAIRGIDEERREDPLVADQRMRSAFARFTPAAPSNHGFDIDLGWLALDDLATDRSEQGPAIAARYSYSDERTAVDATVRRRPMLDGLRTGTPDETRLAVLHRLTTVYGLTGHGYVVEGPGTPLQSVSRVAGGEVGAIAESGANRYQLLARTRYTDGAIAVDEYTAEGRLEAVVGPGSIDARLEVGKSFGDRTGTVLRTASGFNLRSARGWGRIGASYSRDAWSRSDVSLDITGAYRLTSILEIHGALGTSVERIFPEAPGVAQLGAQIDVQSDLSILFGVEKVRGLDGGGDAARFSMGIRKGLPLPVPFPRQRAVQGVVFDDIDGDGERSPDEPYLDGLRLTMGGISVNSKRGHFAFPAEAERSSIEIDPATLGAEFLPPPLAQPDGDMLEIPVHRAASLRVEAFFDDDGDGTRDPTEMPLPDVGLDVSRAGAAGWLLRTGSDGAVELTAVRPGSYVVSVDPSTLPRRASSPGLKSATLVAGEAGMIVLAVPRRSIVLLDATTGAASTDDTDTDADGGRK